MIVRSLFDKPEFSQEKTRCRGRERVGSVRCECLASARAAPPAHNRGGGGGHRCGADKEARRTRVKTGQRYGACQIKTTKDGGLSHVELQRIALHVLSA
jgi:hypothetical protein